MKTSTFENCLCLSHVPACPSVAFVHVNTSRGAKGRDYTSYDSREKGII